MQSLHEHGGTNPEQRPSIEQTLSRDAIGGYIDQKYPIVVQNAIVSYITKTGPQDFIWNQLKSVRTIPYYLRSTLILLCHVWIIVIQKKIINLCTLRIYISLYFFRIAKQSQFIPLQNVVYFIWLHFFVRKIFKFYINNALLFKCPFPGPKC
jgi:hypothetical protein